MRYAHWPTVIVMIIGTAVFGLPASAEAASTSLCKGFSQCEKRGYGHAGYRVRQKVSHWNMSPGTNCTNYAAYRLTAKRLTARPPGTGSAITWAAAARRTGVPVVRTPRRGDIAWWGAHRGASGKLGHVAYVEKVLRNGTVVVSEDNMDRTFAWRRIPKGAHYPQVFIRYPRSDGSVSGRLDAASARDGVVTIEGSASEPDRPGRPVRYLVTIGAPRESEPMEQFEFSTAYFVFRWWRPSEVTGQHRVYLYGLNTAGTAGADALLGSTVVTF
ncbi:hypothetical protein GCM10009821_14550 [Aeromicrobium halocynthiae]|uniref:Peptidase C51 domain-containing protein n=2 Tax=Aeromicrobium halocynthiae TaxID=560557 RepID=A0ABN2VXQ7_9ACTN